MALTDFPTILNEFPATLMQLLVPSVHPIDEAAGSVVEPGANRLDFLAEASGEHRLPALPLDLVFVCLHECHPVEARL